MLTDIKGNINYIRDMPDKKTQSKHIENLANVFAKENIKILRKCTKKFYIDNEICDIMENIIKESYIQSFDKYILEQNDEVVFRNINNLYISRKKDLCNFLEKKRYNFLSVLKNGSIISLITAFFGGVTSGLATRFTAGRKCANVAGFCGFNVGEINKCSANNNLVKAKSMYNKHNMCGGFVGINGETGVIKDSIATGNEIYNKTYTGGYLGGFVGDNSGKIENGTTTVSVTNGKCTGGFCGNNSGEIIGSKSEGNAKANATTTKTKCGGFVGNNDEKGKIDDCTAIGSAKGQEYVGGFAGVNNSEIIDCNANGKATAKTKIHTALAGGFVGENKKGTIISCEATGGADSNSKHGQAKAGGFVGVNRANIIGSKASGYVYLSAGTCHKDDGCGGFVGRNDQGGSIDGCYTECTLETTNKKKGSGFVGEAKNKSTIINSKCKSKIVTKSGIKNNKKFCQNKDKKAVIKDCKTE